MKANKIILNNEVLIDLTGDTVTQSDVKKGAKFHGSDGVEYEGTYEVALQEKTVTPTTEEQTVTPDTGKDGLSYVTVEAIQTETLTVTPSESEQNKSPIEGKYFSQVSVGPIPNDYIIPNFQTKTVAPDTTQQTIEHDEGYNGLSSVVVDAIQTETLNVTPTESVQEKMPNDGHYFSHVTVEAIPSQYIIPTGTKIITDNKYGIDVTNFAKVDVSVSIPEVVAEELTVTPSRETQEFTPTDADYYSKVTVEAIPPDYIQPVLQEKTVTINGDVTPDEGFDGLSKVTVNVAQNDVFLQQKEVTITENGETFVEPDVNYDGLSKVKVNVNVPIPEGYIKPSGSVTVTTNGTHDVTDKTEVVVNVQPNLQEKTFTTNGTFTPDAGYNGFSKVTVAHAVDYYDGSYEVI